MISMSDAIDASFDATNSALKVINSNVVGVGVSQLSDANAVNTVTIAAVAGVKHHLCNVLVTVSAAASEAVAKTITVTDDSTAVWVVDVPVSQGIGTAFSYKFDAPITSAAVNKAMTIVVPALGAASKSRISVVYYNA
jgi:hypothetical protein